MSPTWPPKVKLRHKQKKFHHPRLRIFSENAIINNTWRPGYRRRLKTVCRSINFKWFMIMRGKLFSTFLAHYASVAPPPRLPFPVPFLVLQHSAHVIRRNKKKNSQGKHFLGHSLSLVRCFTFTTCPLERVSFGGTQKEKSACWKKNFLIVMMYLGIWLAVFFFGCKFIYLYQFIFQCVRILSRTTR